MACRKVCTLQAVPSWTSLPDVEFKVSTSPVQGKSPVIYLVGLQPSLIPDHHPPLNKGEGGVGREEREGREERRERKGRERKGKKKRKTNWLKG